MTRFAATWPALVLLGACAALHGDFAAVRDAWLGASYEEVVARWGTPVRSTSFADGRQVYTWHSQGTASRGSVWPSISIGGGSGIGIGVGVGVSAGPSHEVAVSCERTLIFKSARVVEQTWQGAADYCSEFRRN
jgi:hypothetical protein